MSTKSSSLSPSPRVVIIGAGPGGLSTAIALKRQLGFDDFVIYEKGDEVGGTWRANTYPGCSSDVQISYFSLSTDLQSWPSSHGSQEDILAYWVRLAKKYGLYDKIRFNTMVVGAEWDKERCMYRVVTERVGKDFRGKGNDNNVNGNAGNGSGVTAEIVISAIGILDTPKYAQIPGFDTFKGDVFHSARWEKNVELRGRKVAVVGNGASATQFVPVITDDPAVRVTQFCKTPHWMFPNFRYKHSTLKRFIIRYVPGVMRLDRWIAFLSLELLYSLVFSNSITRSLLQKLVRKYIEWSAPEKYRKKLIPTFPLGCKRVILDTKYLEALHKPNLELNWDGIERIVEDGLVTKTGQHIPFDVIIFATGYAADIFPLQIKGTHQTIQEYFEESKGPKAYGGTTVPGFPNFFIVFGPNTGTGHTSVIFTEEVQINYTIQLIKPILEKKIKSIEVSRAATDAYNDALFARMDKSVFTQCHSWYRVGNEGKVYNTFPGLATMFWLWLRKPDYSHYTGVGAERWLYRKQRRQKFLKAVKIFFGLALLVIALRRSYRQNAAVNAAANLGLQAAIKLVLRLRYNRVLRNIELWCRSQARSTFGIPL